MKEGLGGESAGGARREDGRPVTREERTEREAGCDEDILKRKYIISGLSFNARPSSWRYFSFYDRCLNIPQTVYTSFDSLRLQNNRTRAGSKIELVI